MKKIISLLLVCAIVLSFSGCGSDNATKEDTSATEKVTEEESTNKDIQEEVKEEPEEEKLITAAELDAKLAEQPLVISSTNLDPGKHEGEDIYADLLQVVIQNNSGTDIKDVSIGYVGWDENGLPVKLVGDIAHGGGQYYAQADAQGANIVAGGTWGEDMSFQINKYASVDSFKAIVVKYTDFEGNQWNNPCLGDFYKLYKEKRLKDIK